MKPYAIGTLVVVGLAVVVGGAFIFLPRGAKASPKPPGPPPPEEPPAIPEPPPPDEPPAIGVVERPGYRVTPNCGGVYVWSLDTAWDYARTISAKTSKQYATPAASLGAAEAEYYGGCPWQSIRNVAPIFWYRLRVGFYQGAVNSGLMTEAEAQLQLDNMRALPPQGLDPSMMTPWKLWGKPGETV